MWGTVLAIALIAALDPMRLGIAFVLISLPRPVRSLLAYWLGAMVAAVASAVALLTVLRTITPMIADHVAAVTRSSTVGYLQIAIGIIAIPLAVLVAKGIFPRDRSVEMSGGPASLLERPGTPPALARLTAWSRGERTEKMFWVAFVAGVISATPPVEYLVVLAAILGSGVALETQFCAAVMFIVVALLTIEIPLISCLATPARSELLMVRLQHWMRTRARPILASAFTAGGFLLIASGIHLA